MDKSIVIPLNYCRVITPLKIIKDSDKAVRVEFDGNDGYICREWLPKSVCLISDDGERVIAIADWFIAKKPTIKTETSANQQKEKEDPYYFACKKLAAEFEDELKEDPYVTEGELGKILSKDRRFGDDIKTTDINKIKQLIIAKDGEDMWTMTMGYIGGSLLGAIWVITKRPDLINHPNYEWLKTELPYAHYGYRYQLIKPLKIKKETEKAILTTAVVRCQWIGDIPKYAKRDVWIPKAHALTKDGMLIAVSERAKRDNFMSTISVDTYKKLVELRQCGKA